MKSLTGKRLRHRKFAASCDAVRRAAKTLKVTAKSDVPVTASWLEIPRRPACRDLESVAPAAVDKARTQPYLCRTGSMARARDLVAFLAIEPWIAEFPLIWRMLPDRGLISDASR
jgi:hypothetical protein